jgi:hypothetical protein
MPLVRVVKNASAQAASVMRQLPWHRGERWMLALLSVDGDCGGPQVGPDTGDERDQRSPLKCRI